MEGNLVYKIGEVERKFFFGNYALEKTLDDFQSSVSDLSELLGTKYLAFFRAFIYHAACYPLLKEGKEIDFVPFDIHEWIDITGGLKGDFLVKSTQHAYKALGLVVSEETQKKSQPKS